MSKLSQVQTLYTELNKHICTSEYRLVIKTCNKIIHSKDGKVEIEAMMCKIVSLIHLTQFADVLKFIAATPEVQEHSLFEKAYCQLRLLKADEALETVNEMEELDFKSKELKAQILYKLGRYTECMSSYIKLMRESSDDYDDERGTNLAAVQASMSMFDHTETKLVIEPTTHEQLYNAACLKLGQNEAEEAKALLEKAESTCREVMASEPDTTEEEIESELAPIRVQLAFALQLLGDEEKALVIYKKIITSRPTDVAMLAVASNNIITINREQSVFDSRKRMKATIAKGVETKLVVEQRKRIDFNRALLFMYSNQWDSCKDLLKTMKIKYQDEETPYLIHAAMLCREKNLSEAISFLQGYIVKRSDPELYAETDLMNIKLALIQMLLQNDQMADACKLLESIEEICYTPAVVSLLVSLYKKDHSTQAISDLFDRAIKWNKLNKENRETQSTLMWRAALFHIQQKDNQNAALVLEEMLSMEPNNVKVMAQLIFAYAQLNRDKAHQISERLPSLSELSVEVNVDELEASASAPRYIKRQKEKKEEKNLELTSRKDVVSERTGDEVVKSKKKKKKKNPTPKNFQPDYVPDPERWIPLRDRSTYKRRRKDKRKGVMMKGSQGGGTAANADIYDMSAKPTVSHKTAQSSTSKQQAGGASTSGAAAGGSSQGATPTDSPKPQKQAGGAGTKKGGKKGGKKKRRGGGGW